MLFAKKCEGASEGNVWDEQTNQNKTIVNDFTTLIAEGEALYAAETNAFLQQRLGYQLTLLYRYSGKLKEASRAFDKMVATTDQKSIVYWWALAHKAGVEYKQEKFANADFHFAQVFAHEDAKKVPVYISWSGGKTVKQSLALCQNNEQRVNVLTLEGLHNPAKNLDNIKAALALDAAAPSLNVLLVREINKIEDWIMTKRIVGYDAAMSSRPYENNENANENSNYELITQRNLAGDKQYAEQVYQWLKTVQAMPQLHTPALWQVATAHLALFLMNSSKKAVHRFHLLSADTIIMSALKMSFLLSVW